MQAQQVGRYKHNRQGDTCTTGRKIQAQQTHTHTHTHTYCCTFNAKFVHQRLIAIGFKLPYLQIYIRKQTSENEHSVIFTHFPQRLVNHSEAPPSAMNLCVRNSSRRTNRSQWLYYKNIRQNSIKQTEKTHQKSPSDISLGYWCPICLVTAKPLGCFGPAMLVYLSGLTRKSK